MQLALLFLLLIQMHMKTHCFQRISSKVRGGSRIFSQGGSGSQCHRDAAGISVEGTEGGLGGLPQEKLEYEVL